MTLLHRDQYIGTPRSTGGPHPLWDPLELLLSDRCGEWPLMRIYDWRGDELAFLQNDPLDRVMHLDCAAVLVPRSARQE
jgi:hypothetical protein